MKDEIGGETVLIAEIVEFLFDKLVRLFREGGALVEHSVDLLAQHADAPALDAAHLRVKVALMGFVEGDELDEMAPTQFS